MLFLLRLRADNWFEGPGLLSYLVIVLYRITKITVVRYFYLCENSSCQLYFLHPDDGARDTVHLLRGRLNVDLVPLVKPANHFVPELDFWDNSSRLFTKRRIRIGVWEYGDDDIEPGLLDNQASVGELHQGGVGRGAR